jgi:DeoR family transcriptional regulator, fructose operon transcriptional repressor
MYPFERKEKILEKLRNAGRITIGEDARSLGISTSTLHRDLVELETQGIVRKLRGGALLAEAAGFETHFDIRMKTRTGAKEDIARKAVEMIQDDTCIFLDHSSTTVYLAREIKRLQFRNLIVLTNSLAIPAEIGERKGVQVMLTGGVVESGFKALSGRWVIDSLQRLNLHQVFASVGAISTEHGFMTQVPFIHELLPEIFRSSSVINILADSSKFYKIGTFQVAPLSPAFRIFADKGLPKEIRIEIEARGTKIIV